MRTGFLIATLLLLGACGGSGGGNNNGGGLGRPVAGECSVAGQKETTLEIARQWYLWNADLPADIDINDFATVTDLIGEIQRSSPGGPGNPVDRFGSIGSAQADQEFFGEGRFEGLGFQYRFEQPGNVMRITSVYADSPAALADPGPLARGQIVLGLNGRTINQIVAEDGVSGFSAVLDSSPLTLTIRPLEGPDFDTTLSQAIVTIDPVPQVRLIERDGLAPVGYIDFRQFITTAEAELDAAFETFRNQGVSELIIDLRYNGGGLVTTSNVFADLLGGFIADNLIFSETRFNADQADQNTIRRFNLLANSLNISQLVFIATDGSASASELIINGLDPHVDVAIVGERTFGKPIGQSGFLFCDNILRLTTFQLLNANGVGDYFDGLPVTPGCDAPDDVTVPIGADNDPNMIEALGYIATGACPAAATAATTQTEAVITEPPLELPTLGRPERIYADAL